MLVLALMYQPGHFHALPWCENGVPGEPEWPPSPWSLLRSLARSAASLSVEAGRFERLFDKLADPPRFLLPPLAEPDKRYRVDKRKFEVRMTLDAARDQREAAVAYVVWDTVILEHAEHWLLRAACARVGDLGDGDFPCTLRPSEVDEHLNDADYTSVDLSQRRQPWPDGPDCRRLGVSANYRGSGLLEALAADMTAGDARVPAGATWLIYRFPHDYGTARELHAEATLRRASPLPEGGLLRFALSTRRASELPAVSDTLTVAGAFRFASMRRYSDITGRAAPTELSGREDGALVRGHRHAFFLPRDLDSDGRIDHVDVWFRERISHETFQAVRRVHKIYDPQLGRHQTFRCEYVGLQDAPLARCWQSATPFVPGVHQHGGGSEARRARYEPVRQVMRSLEEHALPSASITLSEANFPLYRITRKRDKPIGIPLKATLEFELAVRGPIVLGRYTHFGMGQFVPVT